MARNAINERSLAEFEVGKMPSHRLLHSLCEVTLLLEKIEVAPKVLLSQKVAEIRRRRILTRSFAS